MFELLFKYPMTVFTKGKFVLLGAWSVWILVLLVLAAGGGLGLLLWWRLQRLEPVKDVTSQMQLRRAAAIWALQSALIALVLLLLWQPAIVVAELKSQQNIIAVLIDDSRSMAKLDSGSDGKTQREAAALAVLQNGLLTGLQKRFQTRVYQLDASLTRADKPDSLQPTAAATHISAGFSAWHETRGIFPSARSSC